MHKDSPGRIDQIDRDRILRDLTGLAASLVQGGIRGGQSDLLLLGRVITASIGALDSELGRRELDNFLARVDGARLDETAIRKMLKDLGIGGPPSKSI